MKYLLILVLGFALGIYVDRHYQNLPMSITLGTHPASREPVRGAADELDEKLREWRLTPDDIRDDLARTGEVVRTQVHAVGGKISDARIIAVVKAKYILDRDLAASDIHVAVADGRVTLTGRVGSPGLVGRAIALALDTEGVEGVDSKLGVAPG